MPGKERGERGGTTSQYLPVAPPVQCHGFYQWEPWRYHAEGVERVSQHVPFLVSTEDETRVQLEATIF